MREHHIPITFGSDAHAVMEVGSDFAAAMELARTAGYSSYLQFNQREAKPTSF